MAGSGESDDLAFDTTSSSSDEADVSEATLPSEPDDDDEQLSLSDAGSASASASQRSQSRAKPETAGRRRRSTVDDADWELDPELYGLRRSGRARAAPSRYLDAYSSDSDSDGSEYGAPKRKRGAAKGAARGRARGGARARPGRAAAAGSEEEEESAESTESDSDYGAKRKKFSIKKKRRRKQRDVTPDADRFRFSSRGQGPINYAEDTPSDEVDEGSGVEKEAEGGEAEVDNTPTIERIVLDMPASECIGAGIEVHEEDEDATLYQIKWLGKAYRHNTWESERSLLEAEVKGMQKLQNYIRDKEVHQRWRQTASKEDVEYVSIQKEMALELVQSHLNVERVVAEKQVDDAPGGETHMYLCKWVGLPYADCTWETAESLSDFQSKIDQFLDREASQYLPNPQCPALRERPRFQELKEQPEYLGAGNPDLRLRDYQLDGVNWLYNSWCVGNSVILADEMGLGKTIQSVCFVGQIFYAHQVYGPHLVVVPLSTIAAWQAEFERWLPDVNSIVYIGNKQSREALQEFEFYVTGARSKKVKFNVMITTYEILQADYARLAEFKWASLIVDEAHRLKNHEGRLHQILAQFDTNFRLLVTGTPLQNSLQELWALLKFLMPERFPSWEEFEGAYGTDINSSQLNKLHDVLKNLMIRRVKKDVEKSLPNKIELILRVNMSQLQREYHRHIISKNYSVLRTGTNRTSLTNTMMEMKKCCNHPYLVREPDFIPTQNAERLKELVTSSGKMTLLDKLLVRLEATGHRVLIFSQMVRMLDILGEYLQLRGFAFQRLDGCVRNELRKQAMDHFNAPGSKDFCFLLSTRAGGLGINLATADTVIIFDSDWNPQNDLQAEARAHRIGQKNVVKIYRLVTENSVEETVLQRAKQKLVLDHVVIQSMDTSGRTVLNKEGSATNPFTKEEMSAIMKFGAEDLFAEGGDELAERNLDGMDLDEILERAEKVNQADKESATDEFLAQFKTVNFRMDDMKDWDEIIPEKELEVIKVEEETRRIEEEERERMALLAFGPRQRKVVKQLQAEDVADVKKKGPKKKATKASAPSEEGLEASMKRLVRASRVYGDVVARLDECAVEAGLENRSAADMQRLVMALQDEWDKAALEDKDAKGDKGELSHKSLLEAQARDDDMRVLAAKIGKFKGFRLHGMRPPTKWSVKWGVVEDVNLLFGIHKYGMGSWDYIKADPEADLGKKILLPGDKKVPQATHLATRGQALLKHLRPGTKGDAEKPAKAKGKRAAAVQDEDDATVLEKCKERMRPVKKSIKALGKLPGKADAEGWDDAERAARMNEHVLTIGDFIVDYTSRLPAGEAETAKRELWSFVHRFSYVESPDILQAMYERAKEARMSAPKLVTTVGGTKRGQEDADREAKRPRPEKEKSSEDQESRRVEERESARARERERDAEWEKSRDRDRERERERDRDRDRYYDERDRRDRNGREARERDYDRDYGRHREYTRDKGYSREPRRDSHREHERDDRGRDGDRRDHSDRYDTERRHDD